MQLAALSAPQSRIYAARNRRRFRVVVAGRRFGKTVLALVSLLLDASANPGANFWYIAPTYRQAKLIAWRMLKELCPERIRHGKPNESELYLELVNHAAIHLKGADKPESLRGVKLAGAAVDEFASMRPEVFSEVLRPSLADLQGWALFIGSPYGFNHFHDFYLRGQDPDEPLWYSWQFTTAEGGFIDPQEIAQARLDMDARTFRQEFEASFEALAGRVYYAFTQAVNVDPTIVDTGGELLVGMDFNVDPMSACVAVEAGDALHVLDEVVLPNSNTEEMRDELLRRYHGRTVTVAPDPSGRSRRSSASVGMTDFSILERGGFGIDAPNQAPLIVDRVNTVNANLRSDNGRFRVIVHPRCKHVIRSLEGQTWKEGTRIPDKSGGLDHMADALGYLICAHFGLEGREVSVGELSI